MKFIKSISTSIFTLLLCTACESDLEQVTYSSENAIPSTLSSLNDSYILESKNASQEAFTLTWSYPDLGYQASVINRRNWNGLSKAKFAKNLNDNNF